MRDFENNGGGQEFKFRETNYSNILIYYYIMYNISVFDYKLGTIYFLILCFLLIIFKNMTNTSIEGFNASDITSITSKVTDIASKANEIPGKITEIGTKITNATSDITSTIETKISALEQKIMDKVEDKIGAITEKVDDAKEKIKDITVKIDDIFEKIAKIPALIKEKIDWLIDKIKQLGENIGNVINGGIVDPFKLLFIAIGKVFVLLFVILKKLGHKLLTLPGCFILYWYKSIVDPIYAIYRWIMPNFIEDFIYTIYKYTLKIPIDFISWLFGLDKWWSKCFDFDVDKEVDSIKDAFNDAAKEFRSTFGEMNFKDLIDFSD